MTRSGPLRRSGWRCRARSCGTPEGARSRSATWARATGLLGGINAVIVGNYLTTLGRDPARDLDLLGELQMPIKELSKTL